MDTKFKQSNGNVILNFETQEQRDLAVQKVGELENLSVKKAKKLLPKIMICNVSTEESCVVFLIADSIISRGNPLFRP